MKKLLLAGALALFGAVSMNAQRVQKGEAQINAGVGFGGNFGLPFYAGVDYGVHPNITVGAEASFATKNYGVGEYSFKGTWFGVGANANYHFNTLFKIPNKWDVYAGLTLAYNAFNYSYPKDFDTAGFSSTASGIGFAGQAGARYYLTDHFAINAEFGGGTVATGGKAGISYKF